MRCNRFLFFSVLFLIGIMSICVFISIDPVLGVVQSGIGNSSGYIDKIYAPSQIIRGWINISLINEPSDSLLTVFDSNITIINFLKNNLAYINCTPTDCSNSYDLSNPEKSKTFILKKGEPEK